MAGFRTFATGEVLTAANVNDFLMKQSVMVFADDAARTTALGAEVAEGMLTYNEDTEQLEVFDGSAFVPTGAAGGFDAEQLITVTNASHPVPALDGTIVKVTVVGGGGSGGDRNTFGAAGGTTTFNAGGAGSVSAIGGIRGVGRGAAPEDTPDSVFINGNQGRGMGDSGQGTSTDGTGGQMTVAYLDLAGVSTVNVTIGAGAAGSGRGADGGNGMVLLEFKAA